MKKLNCGNLILIIGPMFSGKTTELMRLMNNYETTKKKTKIFKYSKDNRYSEENICTHDLTMKKATNILELDQITNDLIEPYDVIGVDEIQFFERTLEFANRILNQKKILIISWGTS